MNSNKFEKRIVFFDYDGVIVNTFQDAFAIAHDLDHSIKKEGYRKWFKNNPHQAIEEKEGDGAEKFKQEFFKKFNKKVRHKEVNPKMAEVIKNLADDFLLIIVSSTGSRVINRQLHEQDLDQYFIETLGYDVSASKTKKIKDTLDTFDVKAKQSILITDTLGDIREANEADVSSIGVTWGYHNRVTLQEGSPYKIISKPSNLEQEVRQYFKTIS